MFFSVFQSFSHRKRVFSSCSWDFIKRKGCKLLLTSFICVIFAEMKEKCRATSPSVDFRPAEKGQASAIAALIMEAMNHDCCQNFAGPFHTLDDFHAMLTLLVEAEDSQYSYLNTTVATSPAGEAVGILVSYDGACLRQLRRAFVEAASLMLGRDFSAMEDETQAGELYLDSLAVAQPFRHQGIATQLIRLHVEKARELGLPAVGLLVDQSNPVARSLYESLGFAVVNPSEWGGHPMWHMQLQL